MISAIELARYVVSQANYTGCNITHLKLQKLLYYIQGKYLAAFDKPLFGEQIEAWTYGPVVPEVYYDYVSNGALALQSQGLPAECEPNWTEIDKQFVDTVLEDKLRYSASFLVGATHKEVPWLEHKAEVMAGERPVIAWNSMKRFFLGDSYDR